MANSRPKYLWWKDENGDLQSRLNPPPLKRGRTDRAEEAEEGGYGFGASAEVQYRVRVPASIRDRIFEAAAERDETVARFTRAALEEALAVLGKI